MPTEAVDYVRLVRKVYEYPLQPTDGIVVADFTGSPEEAKYYSDRDLVGPETYYYQFFSYQGGAWHYDLAVGRVKALAFDSGLFEERLWKAVTELYQLMDEVGV